MLVLALAMTVMGAMGLVMGLGRKRPALILLAGAILASHAWPLFQLTGQTEIAATLEAQLRTVGIIAFVASLSWMIGYWLCVRILPRAAAPVQHAETGLIQFHRLTLVVLAGLLLSAPGGVLGFAQTGFLRLPVDNLLFSVTYAVACVAALTTTLLCVTTSTNGTRPPFVSIALVLLVFWLLGGRTQLAISALTFALVYLGHGRIRARTLALPALVLALLATLTLTFRLTLQGEAIDLWGAVKLMSAQLSLLDGYALCARFVAEYGTHAAHYWETALQIVPRAVFPDKPLQLSRALRLLEARDTLGGLTPGLAGEAFVAAGMIGVAGIGVAFGAALALLDNCYLRLASLRPLAQALTVSLLPLLAIFTLRGGFDTSIFRLDIVLVAGLIGLAWRAPMPRARRPVA